jgi:peptidoglycan/LPS O-acetylase OafA/YrhL
MVPDSDVSVIGDRVPGARFEFVDALRGLAALAVVLPHVTGLFAYPRERGLSSLFLSLAGYGTAGVEVFFVVSGFAIAYSMRAIASEDFSLGRFILRRAVRLDPPYWVAMLWVGLVEAFRARMTHQPVVLPSPGKVLAHLLYLQDILGLGQFNAVFWTLCLEFQLYFFFALMMRTATILGHSREAKPRVWRAADKYGWLMAIAFMASLILSHTVWPQKTGWFVPFLSLFLSGSHAAWLVLLVLVRLTRSLAGAGPHF